MENGIYFTLYALMSQYIYGSGTQLTGDMELTLTFICTLGALFIVSMPFLVTWRIVRLFV